MHGPSLTLRILFVPFDSQPIAFSSVQFFLNQSEVTSEITKPRPG